MLRDCSNAWCVRLTLRDSSTACSAFVQRTRLVLLLKLKEFKTTAGRRNAWRNLRSWQRVKFAWSTVAFSMRQRCKRPSRELSKEHGTQPFQASYLLLFRRRIDIRQIIL